MRVDYLTDGTRAWGYSIYVAETVEELRALESQVSRQEQRFVESSACSEPGDYVDVSDALMVYFQRLQLDFQQAMFEKELSAIPGFL